jgi:hypothetical protein
MSTTIMEAELIEALSGDPALAYAGVSTVAAAPNGVRLLRHGVALAVWRWRNGVFELMLPTSDEPVCTSETIAEALRHSRERFIAS